MAQSTTLDCKSTSDVKIREQEVSSAEALLGAPEPWESWETKLVVYSIAIAILGLLVLGWLVNTFILH